MKARYLDHIDLRVKELGRARNFYQQLLPALGFTSDRSDSEWGTFYSVGGDQPPAFFGFTEDPQHQPNGNRIAFWATTRSEVDEIAKMLRQIGAAAIEGPELCREYSPGYYAVFFEDPDGNKLEICSREQPVIEQ
jgi:catechol 2,3-dioxygenase-like lactoylglutathione lyase family enzyme